MSNILEELSQTALSPENILPYIVKLNDSSAPDISDLIQKKPSEEQILIFNSLTPSQSVRTFEYLPFKIQKHILQSLPYNRVATLLNALAPDDRTSLLEELPNDLMHQLLKYLNPEERALSTKLLGYPENSVGRLMTPDYISVKLNWTVKQVLDHIRETGHDSETVNVIYAVDDNGILIDDFRIREFLFAPLESHVSDLSDHKFIALSVAEDEETAINIFRKYDRSAMPVVDSKGVLLGIVTVDDIMEVATEEATEDMQKLGGTEALDEPYMQISFLRLMNKRVVWLIVLFLGELLTASAMAFFQDEIAKAVVLSMFIPLIISSGGNAGSQASSLIIRAIALGEVTFGDWWRIMRREIFSGIFLGAVLGLIGFFRIAFWSQFSDVYGLHGLLIAWTVGLSLIGVVLWGTLAGAMLPLLLKKLGQDPAVSSAPFVATLVDVTGLIIYFSIAILILSGTLL